MGHKHKLLGSFDEIENPTGLRKNELRKIQRILQNEKAHVAAIWDYTVSHKEKRKRKARLDSGSDG